VFSNEILLSDARLMLFPVFVSIFSVSDAWLYGSIYCSLFHSNASALMGGARNLKLRAMRGPGHRGQ